MPTAPSAGPSKAQQDPLSIKHSKQSDRNTSGKESADRDASSNDPANRRDKDSEDGPPRKRSRPKPPKPTESLQQRRGPLNIDANEGRSMMVQSTRGAGWHCTACNILCKDSARWLDHINGRHHLRQIGQTTQVKRVNIEDVRAKLDALRSQLAPNSASGTTPQLLTKSQRYDFDQRIQAIADQYANEKRQRRESRHKAKADARKATEEAKRGAQDMDAMAMLGFGSFGSTKR